MSMLDILTVVHDCADAQTAARIRCTCRKLAVLIPKPILYRLYSHTLYEYRVGEKLHRLDGPAIKGICGFKTWYRGGIRHREYHPYYTSKSYTAYRVNDELHREVGPSVIREQDIMWCMRGRTHRKIGPADNFGEMEVWCTSGEVHRLDAPVYQDIYAIRGKSHRISSSTGIGWVVNGSVIRE